jgi:hypothetical protein
MRMIVRGRVRDNDENERDDVAVAIKKNA